jgi:hypothetical protein
MIDRTVAAKVRLELLDRFWIAVVLSALYPTIFALSNNWYSISPDKVVWLLAGAVVAGVALYALVKLVVSAIGCLIALLRPTARDSWICLLRAALFAVACTALLFSLLAGTIKSALGGLTAVGVALAVAMMVGLWVLFARGLQRHFNIALGLLCLLATGSWLLSVGGHILSTPATAKLIDIKQEFEQAKFAERPNVYLFIYDAYGSDTAYRRIFRFDNSAHYRALRERGFKVIHTFSNYWWTWPTVISVFLGNHNYYSLSDGVADTTPGRKFMAGLLHNPVFETFRSNGYRLQQIHGSDYLVTERGKLDFLFPEEPAYNALKIYNSPLVNALFSANTNKPWERSIEEQKQVLLSRLPDPPRGTVRPWLSFSHIGLPGHGPTDRTWLTLKSFEQTFVDMTVRANEHMRTVIDAIAAKDPRAIIVIIGDHGAWRYRRVWTLDRDPNSAFEKAGIEPEIITDDLFGVMIAVRSTGGCEDYLYPGATPVNVMRIVFACLARDPKLLEGRSDDVSIAWVRNLWLTAKGGWALPQWRPYKEH